MRKVLVTGADGFIGSHLVENLIKRGYKVKALCFYNSNGSYGWLDTIDNEIKKSVEFILGDIRDPISVKNAMCDSEIVFHLAALISIPYSYEAPSSYINTNILGTLNILQAAKELADCKVIHTSTSETYGTAQFVPITQEHPLVGQSPYSASKIGADQLAISYWRSFKTPIKILRPFNTYGPRQSSRAVIPTIISQIARGNKEINLGSLTPTRDFNFVEDTCAAFIALSESNNCFGEVVNAASNFEISIGQTAQLISEIMGKEIDIIRDQVRVRPENSEVNRLFGDNKKLKKFTDWNPKFIGIDGFKKGLEITCDWFCEPKNLAFYKSDTYLK